MKKLSLVALVLFAAVVVAQDEAKKTLAFDAPPATWKARPPEKKPFLHDYDLPHESGDGRVNVLSYPVGFEEYRTKLIAHWMRADGTPLALDDQSVETSEANGLKLRLVEQRGTRTQKDGPALEGHALVAVHVRSPATGHWSAWLLGPEKSVAAHRQAFLAWVKTVRLVDPPAAPADEAIRDVRFVHGAPAHGVPGPWALAGHRIGKHALAKLGIGREQTWETTVTYRAPREVRYTCVLDGLQAATGASLGKMNLVFEAVEGEAKIEVVVVHQRTGRTLTYKLAPSFAERFRATDYAQFPEAARALAALADDAVFTLVETRTADR